MQKMILTSLLLILISTNAFALGAAGCGVGSLIWTKNTVLSQTFAASTNESSSQGTSISPFGTSNCKTSGIVSVPPKEKERILYAEQNFYNLSIEMAYGAGEKLLGFAQTLDCSEESLETFGRFTRVHYRKIFPSKETKPIEMLMSVKKLIKDDKYMSKLCLSEVG